MLKSDPEWCKQYIIHQVMDYDEGSIMICFDIKLNDYVLIRCISKSNRSIPFEVHIAKMYKHRNIVPIINIFETSQYFSLVMPYPIGHLHDYLMKNIVFIEKEAQIIAKQSINALIYLHSNDICHGNLSLENILLYESADSFPNSALFNFSRAFSSTIPKKEAISQFRDIYTAPEVLQEEKFNEKIDVYSLGVVLYMLLTGRNPFDEQDRISQVINAINGNVDFKGIEWKCVSTDAALFVQAMMCVDPELRPSASQCLAFDWVTPEENKDFIHQKSRSPAIFDLDYDFGFEYETVDGAYY